jgi:DNA-binding NtrC family response regulator
VRTPAIGPGGLVCYVTRDELQPAWMIQFLADRGWGTIWCGDGRAAVRWISDQHADVVLIDRGADKDRRLMDLLLNEPQLGDTEIRLVDGDGFRAARRLN